MDVSNKHCEVDHPDFWQTVHTIRIVETNALGSYLSYARFKMDELLKPNPPQSVTVTEVEGYPQRLMVSWSFPSSWPEYAAFPLLFQIRYRPHGSSHWLEFDTPYSSFMILDALAGYLHQIQVRVRDEVTIDSQWSEWSPMQYAKPWEDGASTQTDEIPVDYSLPSITEVETSTAKSHNPDPNKDVEFDLVILLVLFSVAIMVIFIPLVFLIWMKQRRQNRGSKHELTSMVKMKAMPI